MTPKQSQLRPKSSSSTAAAAAQQQHRSSSSSRSSRGMQLGSPHRSQLMTSHLVVPPQCVCTIFGTVHVRSYSSTSTCFMVYVLPHLWNPQTRTTAETVLREAMQRWCACRPICCLRGLWWRSALQTSLSSWNRTRLAIPWYHGTTLVHRRHVYGHVPVRNGTSVHVYVPVARTVQQPCYLPCYQWSLTCFSRTLCRNET
jgi:hypothetical protein